MGARCSVAAALLAGWLVVGQLEPRARRQAALDLALAVNRLRTLERLDSQLRAFAARAGRAPSAECWLPLGLAPAANASRPACDERLVPPYLANLRRQLVAESGSLAEAVQLMPYGAHVIRGLRQPQPTAGE